VLVTVARWPPMTLGVRFLRKTSGNLPRQGKAPKCSILPAILIVEHLMLFYICVVTNISYSLHYSSNYYNGEYHG